MSMSSLLPPSDTSSKRWSYRLFGEQNFWRAGMLSWWYRWTAPADVSPGASFQQRDLVRRGRIASAVMLFLTIVLLAVAAIGFFGPNKQIFYTALLVWATIGVCVVLNRRKHVNLVGMLLCLSVNAGMYLSILRAPGGLGMDDKDILYLLVFADLFVGAILPASWIWVPLLLNIFFSTYELMWAAHTPALELLLQTSRFTILTRVFQMHVFVTGVLWILNAHARATIARANQAEETARLHHDLGLDMMQRQQQAEELRQATKELVQTLMRVMRGDLSARASTQQGGTFWTLGGMLNNLLTRYQRAVLDARELQILRLTVHQQKSSHQIAQRLMQEQARIQEAVIQARHEQRPFLLPDDVVLLEPFLLPLQGHLLMPATIESMPPGSSGAAGERSPISSSGAFVPSSPQQLPLMAPASRPSSPMYPMSKEVSHD